jgi:hypothetical protein
MQSASCLQHNKKPIHTQPNILPLWTSSIQSVAPTPHSVHCTFHCTLSVGKLKGCCTVHFVLCSVSYIRSSNSKQCCCVSELAKWGSYEENRLVRCDVTAVWHCAAGACLCIIVLEYPSAITRAFVIKSVIVGAISLILVPLIWKLMDLLKVPMLAVEGYSSKLIIFTPQRCKYVWNG